MSAEKPEYIADSAEVTLGVRSGEDTRILVVAGLAGIEDMVAAGRWRRRVWQEAKIAERERDAAVISQMRQDIVMEFGEKAAARLAQRARELLRTPEDDLRIAQARAKRARKAAARRGAP